VLGGMPGRTVVTEPPVKMLVVPDDGAGPAGQV
jgi:hypothetical protein